jgi:putative intracellular protease/amidase
VKIALAIRHVHFEDLGSLEAVLAEQGYGVAYAEAGLDNIAALDPLEPDLLVVLGGPIGAYEEASYPFVLDEVTLLEKRLAADLPTLGVCLGSQLMARALGARVYPASRKEIGCSTGTAIPSICHGGPCVSRPRRPARTRPSRGAGEGSRSSSTPRRRRKGSSGGTSVTRARSARHRT